MDSQFTVKVGEVEGPLDLILSLIEERRMLISDVSLSKIADDFIAYVKSQIAFPAGIAAQFILTAATLLLLKSKALLPIFALTPDEEGDIKDLERRLALLQVFRGIARRLFSSFAGRLYFGGLARDLDPMFAPAPDMTSEALLGAARATLARAPEAPPKLSETRVQKTVSLEEMMLRLSARVERALALTFREFVGSSEDKRELVVGFLAVLELVKRGLLIAEQEAHFTDIRMNFAGAVQAPRYD